MAFIQVWFNDLLKEEFELSGDRISIGRTSDNQIRIDNPSVSSHHAVLVQQNAQFYVEDQGSKNGTFVNGKPATTTPLQYGDEIRIVQYTLKFCQDASGVGNAVGKGEQLINQNATIAVDASRINALVGNTEEPTLPNGVARLYIDQKGAQQKLTLERASYQIGKAKYCDVNTGGWFAPKVAAVIERRKNGYTLTPKAGKVLVNGQKLSQPAVLKHGDRIQVRNLTLKFFLS